MKKFYVIKDGQADEYAQETAKTVTERSYVNGSSRDVRRGATKCEQLIVAALIRSALLAASDGIEDDAITATACAEYALRQLLPALNSYDTIHIPVMDYLEGRSFEK